MKLQIAGEKILISKTSSAGVRLNNESLEKIIFQDLPKTMKDYKDYVCNLKIELEIYGAENNELKVSKDYEEGTMLELEVE